MNWLQSTCPQVKLLEVVVGIEVRVGIRARVRVKIRVRGRVRLALEISSLRTLWIKIVTRL